MDNAMSGIVNVMTAIVGVAALAVIFSRNSNTAAVIKQTGGAFAQSIMAANAPVRGNSTFGMESVMPTVPGFGSM